MEQPGLVLVLVTVQKTCARLIREGAKLAQEQGTAVHVIHVAMVGAPLMAGASSDMEALNELYTSSAAAGAEMSILRSNSAIETVVSYAKEHNAAHIVMGASRQLPRGMDFTQLVSARLPQCQIHVVMGE